MENVHSAESFESEGHDGGELVLITSLEKSFFKPRLRWRKEQILAFIEIEGFVEHLS